MEIMPRCYTLALLLGYLSLSNPLQTIFIWTTFFAYSAFLLRGELEIPHLENCDLVHYCTTIFVIFCVFISALKLKRSKIYESVGKFRLCTHFRQGHLYRLLFCCTLTSVIVAVALNGKLSHTEFIAIGVSFVLIDWRFVSVLIQVTRPSGICTNAFRCLLLFQLLVMPTLTANTISKFIQWKQVSSSPSWTASSWIIS